MIYIVIFMVNILVSIPIKVLGKKHYFSYVCLGLVAFILSVFSGIRWRVGTDFYTYQNIFKNILNENIEGVTEPLFYLLTAAIRNSTSNSQVFFIVTSIIINVLIILILYKKSSDFTFSLFLYISMGFYFTSFNILRQFIAMAIMFYIINCREKLSKFNIIIAVTIAIGFHSTSIVMLILVLFKKEFKVRNVIIIAILVSGIAYIFEPLITEFVVNGKYEDYGNTVFFSYGTSTLYIVEYIALLGFYYIYDKNINNENKFYLMTIAIGLIFTILGLKGVLYNRISIGFNFYNMLLLPNVITEMDNKKEKRLLMYAFVVIYTLRLILILKNMQPYSTNYNFVS